jgi:hypothetical protein
MLKYLVAVCLTLCFWPPSYAATVQLDGTGTIAEKIFNIEIGVDTFYDVILEYVDGSINPYTSFIDCDFINAPDVPCDAFADNVGGAVATGAAIELLIDSYNTETIQATRTNNLRVGDSGGSDVQFFVPYKFGQGCNDFCAERIRYNVSTWFHEDAPDLPSNTESVYARFTPAAPVPLPPAMYMFLSGIAVLGWFRRRKPG